VSPAHPESKSTAYGISIILMGYVSPDRWECQTYVAI
jgi:hypothetical protein